MRRSSSSPAMQWTVRLLMRANLARSGPSEVTDATPIARSIPAQDASHGSTRSRDPALSILRDFRQQARRRPDPRLRGLSGRHPIQSCFQRSTVGAPMATTGRGRMPQSVRARSRPARSAIQQGGTPSAPPLFGTAAGIRFLPLCLWQPAYISRIHRRSSLDRSTMLLTGPFHINENRVLTWRPT